MVAFFLPGRTRLFPPWAMQAPADGGFMAGAKAGEHFRGS
jgi:hypothetical protein